MFLPEKAVFEFEDGEAEMRLAGLSTRRFLELQALLWDTPVSEEWLAQVAALVDEFRASWSWDWPTAMDAPWQYNVALARAWLREIGRAPLPLPVRRSEPDSSSDPT